MKKYAYLSAAALAALPILSGCAGTPAASETDVPQYDVAAIIWPAYQPEPRWKELGIFQNGVGEWQNVYEAKPKRPDHDQPKVPLWGYEDESNPIAVARKIDAALAAGINVFMYDWYWYGGKPFLENALNEGFLKAPNHERMKFYILYANHDVTGLWNNKAPEDTKNNVIWKADVSFDEFVNVLVPRWIAYFKKPNYYKIQNKPVFSLYKLDVLARGMGGIENVKKAFERFDAAAKKAGFAGVHFMWNNPVTPYNFRGIELPGNKKPTPREVAEYMGFESHSTYNWCSEAWSYYSKANPELDYAKYAEYSVGLYDTIAKRYPQGQFFPHVSLAWDTNPRFIGYRPKVHPAKPADFERALRAAKKWIDENRIDGMPRLITINAWNEWTEGCHLEPDAKTGYGYLNAVSRVFGARGQAK